MRQRRGKTARRAMRQRRGNKTARRANRQRRGNKTARRANRQRRGNSRPLKDRRPTSAGSTSKTSPDTRILPIGPTCCRKSRKDEPKKQREQRVTDKDRFTGDVQQDEDGKKGAEAQLKGWRRPRTWESQ